eukprot:45475-Prymnesium_polylepis.1
MGRRLRAHAAPRAARRYRRRDRRVHARRTSARRRRRQRGRRACQDHREGARSPRPGGRRRARGRGQRGVAAARAAPRERMRARLCIQLMRRSSQEPAHLICRGRSLHVTQGSAWSILSGPGE